MYLLKWKINNYARVHSAIDNNGVVLSDLINSGRFPEIGYVNVCASGKHIGDFVHSISQELIVSETAMKLLRGKFDTSDISQVKIQVRKGGKMIRDDYTLLFPHRSWDILDKCRAKFGMAGSFIFDVSEWVIDKEKLPHTSLFYAEPGDWVVTDDLGEKLLSSDLIGALLIPISS